MNIIYFNPDEMRANVLGCYGHPLVKTPNIDRFASQGVRFDQCHVQHTVCTPSRCSFMTGWYPHVRGHRTLWHSLRPDEPNTLRYLKQAGYQVHWRGKNDLLSPGSFEESVTTIKGNRQAEHAELCGGASNCYEEDDVRQMNFLRGPMDGAPGDLIKVRESIDIIRNWKPGDAPFMLYIPIGFPHCPYTAPEPCYSMYDPEDLPPLLPADDANKPLHHEAIKRFRELGATSDYDMRKIMAVYLGMVSYVDHLFGQLLDALEECGLSDSTSVFFFSDHGDWAGDYGLVEKWPNGLDDCLTRIPMIVRTPDCVPGHEVMEQIECFDIMPTTLELAGLTPTHTHFARSMMPQLAGEAGDPDRAIFAEGGYGEHELHCFEGKPSDNVCGNPNGVYYPKGMQQQKEPKTVSRSAMIRTPSHKLVRRAAGDHELYDLREDPNELRNVFGKDEYRDEQVDLQTKLLDWFIQTSDVTPFEADPRGFDGAPAHYH